MREKPQKQHILTILLEDYFQVGAFDHLIREQNWSRFEPRYEQNTLKTLDLLDKNKTKATFFVLGWIAEQSPDLIREIVRRGHEVASRGYNHCPVSRMSPAEFCADVLRTREVLEKAAGQHVFGHRAAEKLNYQTDSWTLDILAQEGFEYDASFLPTWSAVKDARFRRFAHEHRAEDKTIWELPYSTRRFANVLLPISGGNYFRQIPYTLVRRAVQNWHETTDEPFVMYFHVWELDTEQPRINAATSLNKIRHYRKLDKMAWILNENLTNYQFTSARDFLGINSRACIYAETAEIARISTTDSPAKTNAVAEAQKDVTVVIPCYNEEKTLPYLANTLQSLEKRLEQYKLRFVFVDDKSKDATFARLQEIFAAWNNVRVVQHEKNQGVAAAILTGLRAAETEIVCSIDADCTYDPHELANMIPLLTEETAMVTASPYHPEGGVRNVPAWRLGLSKGASWLYRRTLRQNLHTFTSCFRVYRRSIVSEIELTQQGFLGVAELLGKLVLRGEKIVEHPAVLEVRLFGFSKMKTARTIIGHLKLLSRLALMRWRGKELLAKKQQTENLISEKSLSNL
jgi:polysaccharide deacetylase family protein (PEP-CTERM system associated)